MSFGISVSSSAAAMPLSGKHQNTHAEMFTGKPQNYRHTYPKPQFRKDAITQFARTQDIFAPDLEGEDLQQNKD